MGELREVRSGHPPAGSPRVSLFEGIERVSSEPVGGPVASLEFRRIRDLPRRRWDDADDLLDLVTGLTQMLRTPNGTMTLKRVQAVALRELHDTGMLFGPIPVGEGKTLITLLAPMLMGAKCPLLLMPASVRDQTKTQVLPAMRLHWQLHPNLTIVGYEELSLEKNAELLDRLRPDMILADECHMLRNVRSGRTRRVARYMRENPSTRFVPVSGTIASFSILHYWHLIQWALHGNAPMPRGWNEAQEWANALDERVPDQNRTGPGALATLPGSGSARRKYRERLVETPGVIAMGEEKLGTSLRLIGIRDITLPGKIEKILWEVEGAWETPSGEAIIEAVQMWAILRQLVSGFYYVWQDPQPSQEWLAARKAWGHQVRETIKTNRRKLDTPLQVWNEQARKHKKGCSVRQCAWCEWSARRHDYTPKSIPKWISPYLANFAALWLAEQCGICWVEHRAIGEKIAALTGLPYFGAGNSGILTAEGPIITSIAAHGTGKNLQQWDRNLVLCPPSSGSTWEQLMGRTHRMGQLSDTVTVEVPQHHSVFTGAMEQAFLDAKFLEESLGNRQRLLYCDTDMREQA